MVYDISIILLQSLSGERHAYKILYYIGEGLRRRLGGGSVCDDESVECGRKKHDYFRYICSRVEWKSGCEKR